MSSWLNPRFRREGIIFIKGSCIIRLSVFHDSMVLGLLTVYAFFLASDYFSRVNPYRKTQHSYAALTFSQNPSSMVNSSAK
jgi:hypothetical protein